jgi:glucose/arabinose dehydrogenase
MTHRKPHPSVLIGALLVVLCACSGTSADDAADAYLADPRLSFRVFASGLGAARQLAIADNGDVFVNHGKVSVLWDADHDGASGAAERALFAEAPNLNHGLAFDRGQRYLYASSDTTVYRFAYTKGQRAARGAAQVVVHGMPGGGHSTRTLAFDAQNRLYVSVGSSGNVDTGEEELRLRSQIRRFVIPSELPNAGLSYESGSVIASGMRNEVGLYIDANDRLWGVENGRDNLQDADFGGDIHTDNPGEKINLIDGPGPSFYGYPSCWSEYKLAHGFGPGASWADESVPERVRYTDARCQDASQVHPAAFVMQAHWAPLGVLQYTGSLLPYRGDLLIAAHGSWNRSPAVGRLIARAHFEAGKIASVTPIIAQKSGTSFAQGTWGVRPVDLRQAADGTVFCSDDMGGRIFRIGYAPK